MKIQDLLRKDVMLLDLQATEKTAVIDEMIKNLTDHGYVTDFETFKEGILAREALILLVWVMESQCLTAKTLLSKKRQFYLLSQIRVLTTRAWMDKQLTSSS